MRKLVMGTFVSLDGVMQAPGGPEEDPEGGFPYGGWQFPFGDEELGEIVTELFTRTGAFLLGRKTYDIFAGYWPNQAGDDPVTRGLNELPKYVVSTTLGEPTWNNTTVIRSDVPAAVRRLKEQDGGDILIQGSAALLPTLYEHDLVDEFLVGIYPVVLGQGKRLFAEGLPGRTLRLTDSRRTNKGAVFNTYEPVGEVQTGSF
ncbi:dihydrofolate reductase family protein [Georgenia subflava]|uniref:Dihydrofolate reductase n=1 Tax=Georgenia subflava TaxID=1622177 RepID=A0A6N7EGQ3_9MICO|nr:dihydrofolate reductase family protein [Georgenia subflava]MPV36343.1 dihydrofolate reductase [Georgenia subflava]